MRKVKKYSVVTGNALETDRSSTIPQASIYVELKDFNEAVGLLSEMVDKIPTPEFFNVTQRVRVFLQRCGSDAPKEPASE
jgi:hypothetical protein